MIKETITFTFETEEQKQRFHARLNGEAACDAEMLADSIVTAFCARYFADGHGKLEAGLADHLREVIESALRQVALGGIRE